MSSPTSMRCVAASDPAASLAACARPIQVDPWRAVEAQHVVSTRKLVDSDAEQLLLEELLETSKPPLAPDLAELHYLLFTPFRYPPLRWGSRFGTRAERGIFYGSCSARTCFAEVAYYRLIFLQGTQADLGPLLVELTLFQCRLRASCGLDLTRAPFAERAAALTSVTSYAETQRLGGLARRIGAQVLLFTSARDRQGGVNVAVLDPAAFAVPRPTVAQRWLCAASHQGVELRRLDPLADREVHRFPRQDFLCDGALPPVPVG